MALNLAFLKPPKDTAAKTFAQLMANAPGPNPETYGPSYNPLFTNKPDPRETYGPSFNPKFAPKPGDPTYPSYAKAHGLNPNAKPPGWQPPAPTTKTTTAPPATAGTSAPGAGGGSWADLLQIATKLAAAGVDPQIAAIQRQIDADNARRAAQQYAGMGVMQALAQLGAGIPGAIQQAYAQAGQETAGYAQGLTGVVGQQAQDAAAQAGARLAGLNAPGTITSQSPAAMNVANYVGGYLPSTDLAQEAANRMAQAAIAGYAAPATVAYQTLQQLGATDQEIRDLQAKGLDIENTRPAAIQQALLQLRQLQQGDVQNQIAAKQLADQEKAQAQAWQQTLWQRKQTVAAAKAATALANAKNKREAAAFALQVQDYYRKAGMTNAQILKTLGDSTGTIWKFGPKGQPVDTGALTPAGAKQQEIDRHNKAMERNAQVANRIRQQNANTQQNKAAAAADKTKGTGGLTANQVTIRENTWMGTMSALVDKAVGAQKSTNKITGAVTVRPPHMPPKKADLVRKIYNAVGPQLLNKIPRWTEPYLKSLIYAYVSTLPNAWWDPKSYTPVKKK